MRFDEHRSRPLWCEQGDEIYGHNLSPVERFLDELDNFPRHHALDRSSAHCTRKAAPDSPSSGGGHNFEDAA